jgi:acetylornithine deacetylase/succinyl-diaminopimelate desuccinylase-like protein
VDDHSKIRQHVQANATRYLDSLKQACAIPSISTEGRGFEDMTAWLEARLKGLGAEVSRLSVPGSPDALLGEIKGAGARTLMIYDHYDVQPVDPLNLWLSPPFEPTEREGKLFARGAADNKGDLVARLSALEVHRDLYGDLPFNIKFLIEGEEESGSAHFDQICMTFADQLRCDDCVWEGGWFDTEGRPEMYYGCKGLLYVELRCKRLRGDQHSSIAVYAPAAAWDVLKAVASLKDDDGRIAIEGFYDDIAEPGEVEEQLIDALPFNEKSRMEAVGIEQFLGGLTGYELKRELLYGPTANIAGFHTGYGVPGGQKTVLPAEALAKVDFRLAPDQKPGDIAKKLRRHLDDRGFKDIEMEVLSAQTPSRSPLDSALGRAAQMAARKWFPLPVSVYPFMLATGPMFPVNQALGIPVCSPPGVGRPDSNLHAPNEWCSIVDYLDIIGYTVCYLREYGRL